MTTLKGKAGDQHRPPHHFPNPPDIYFSFNRLVVGLLYTGSFVRWRFFILEVDVTDRELLELAAKAAGKRERHGMNKTPEHRAWVHMKQRCNNPKKREYQHYGGRGIKVCEEWMNSFTAFYNHVGKRPSDKHSLDRIDVNGNYEPGNVRWATNVEQKENTRVVRMVTLNGKTQSLSAWTREMGLARGQINGRLKAGWSIEEAILTPSLAGQKKHMKVTRDYSTYQRDSHGRFGTD